MRSVKTYRNLNDSSEFLGLSMGDLFVAVGVFLLGLALLRNTEFSILAILFAGATLGALVMIRKGKRRKIIRDSIRKFSSGRRVYDPRSF